LKQLAIRATTIRADIRKKVELHSPVDEVPSLDRWNKRTRKGQKHSTKADNPEGLKEKDIKAREVLQIFPVRKFKKRTSSQLSYNEVTDIVDTYLHKQCTQAEVARQFRVTTKLVSNLVNKHIKHPDLFQNKKRKEYEIAQTHFALTDTVNELMKNNVPITTAKIIKEKT